MEFLVTLSHKVDPESPTNDGDEGDGIMDMMLKPALKTYESRESGPAPKAELETDEDDWTDKLWRKMWKIMMKNVKNEEKTTYFFKTCCRILLHTVLESWIFL